VKLACRAALARAPLTLSAGLGAGWSVPRPDLYRSLICTAAQVISEEELRAYKELAGRAGHRSEAGARSHQRAAEDDDVVSEAGDDRALAERYPTPFPPLNLPCARQARSLGARRGGLGAQKLGGRLSAPPPAHEGRYNRWVRASASLQDEAAARARLPLPPPLPVLTGHVSPLPPY
jgi:hypothetical protein